MRFRVRVECSGQWRGAGARIQGSVLVLGLVLGLGFVLGFGSRFGFALVLVLVLVLVIGYRAMARRWR